jgi:hypothetical protein
MRYGRVILRLLEVADLVRQAHCQVRKLRLGCASDLPACNRSSQEISNS